MTRKAHLRALTALLVTIMAAPVTAAAKDLCIDLDTPDVTIVLKGFSLPGKAKCKPVAGWIPGRAFKDLVSGSACRFSDASMVWFTLQSTPVHLQAGFGYSENYTVTLDAVSLTGTSSWRKLVHGTPPVTAAAEGGASASTCVPKNVPFP
jgi:hypothetical protein